MAICPFIFDLIDSIDNPFFERPDLIFILVQGVDQIRVFLIEHFHDGNSLSKLRCLVELFYTLTRFSCWRCLSVYYVVTLSVDFHLVIHIVKILLVFVWLLFSQFAEVFCCFYKCRFASISFVVIEIISFLNDIPSIIKYLLGRLLHDIEVTICHLNSQSPNMFCAFLALL